MVKVRKIVLPKPIVWDEQVGKFRYLGKASDRIGNYCPIGKTTVEWCLQRCEFCRTAPVKDGFQLVCAYEAIVGQTIRDARDNLKFHPEDLIDELRDGMDWHLNEKKDEQLVTFKPKPENPYGYTRDGVEPWEMGEVERPEIDPRIKRVRWDKKGKKVVK